MSRNRLFDYGRFVCMGAFGLFWPILAGLVIMAALLNVALAQAEGPNQVGLVVVHGDGSVQTRCIEFGESKISGYDVLDRSGLDLNVEPSGGMGAAICRIDNEGCTFPQDACFCQCAGGGSSCTYWSYWHLAGDGWQYSGSGASNHFVSHGDVEGWVWGLGTVTEAAPPPVIPFAEICTPLTATPTPTDTPTWVPASTPTNTPQPTNTPRPPTIAYFSAERTTINAGESVTLSWDLSGAQAAYLRYEGTEEGVVAPGGKSVSPAITTVYTLVARNDGGETTAEVTITVFPVTHTPLPTDSLLPASLPTATQALPPPATSTPTDVPPNEPMGTASPSGPSDTPIPPPPAEPTYTPLPPVPPTPRVTPTATSTPAPAAAVMPPSGIEKQGTPPVLLRDTLQRSGPYIPVILLAVVGIFALLGGLAGMLLLLLAIRQGNR